jgi:dolichol-phosphate hexosyltransferase
VGLDAYGTGFRASVGNDEVFLSIVMPTYNEGRTIRRAIRQVLATSYPCRTELIVVDDGSSDETAKQLDGLSCDRLKICRHSRNRGKGAALLTGMSLASGTHMVPFDADLEYSPTDVARMLEPVLDGRAEVVYGTRLFGLNTVYHSFRYKMGNRATTLAANLLFDSAVTDMHTCLKLLPLALVREMRLVESGFGMDTEITANVLKMGYRPFEVPVAYYARSHLQGKKINWRDGVQCLRILARVRMANLLQEKDYPTGSRMSDRTRPLIDAVPSNADQAPGTGRSAPLVTPPQSEAHSAPFHRDVVVCAAAGGPLCCVGPAVRPPDRDLRNQAAHSLHAALLQRPERDPQ